MYKFDCLNRCRILKSGMTEETVDLVFGGPGAESVAGCKDILLKATQALLVSTYNLKHKAYSTRTSYILNFFLRKHICIKNYLLIFDPDGATHTLTFLLSATLTLIIIDFKVKVRNKSVSVEVIDNGKTFTFCDLALQ